MARDGTGTYNLPAGQPVVTGTTISSTTHNALASDLATALTSSLAKDGQTTPTANLPMGTFKHTNVASASALTDYASASQVGNSTLTNLSSVAGTNTVTGSAAITPSAYATGQRFHFIPAATNTGATTLNVSSLGAKNIFWNGAACIGGELRISVPVVVEYDGTQFNVVGNGAHAPFTNPSNRDQTLTDGATVNWDMNSGSIATVTLGGNRTMAAPTNLKKGTCILYVNQDATGSRTITWNAVFKWASGTAPTLSTGVSKKDLLTFVCDGTNLYGAIVADVR